MALTRITKGVIKPNENYQAGIVTATGLDVNGNGDISGDLNVGGILTYEDVTSIDAVGIITAQQGIHVGAGVSAVGVGTFSGLDISGDIDVDGHTNLDNVSVAGVTTFSETVNGTNLILSHTTPTIQLNDSNNNPDYVLQNNNGVFRIRDNTNSADRIVVNTDGHVDIGNLDVTGDLDVDGHTNLDNVSVAGVSTFSGNILPGTDSSHNIGSNSVRFANVYGDALYGVIQNTTHTNITRVGTLSQLAVSGTANPLNVTHTSANCVNLNRGGKSIAIDVNYGGSNTHSLINLSSGMDLRFKLGGTDKIVFKSAGHIEPITDSQINLGSNSVRFANAYVDTYYGDGSNLTGLSGVSVANQADNRLITATGTTDALNAEAALTFYNSGSDPILTITNSGNPQLRLTTTSTTDNCTIDFGDADSVSRGRIVYANNGDNMLFYTSGTSNGEKLKLYSNGRLNLSPQRSIHADTMLHVEAPSSISSGETNVKFEGDATMGARLSLHNNNTSASANNQIAFCDAGGQSTSTITGYNTDQTNNYGELAFSTRSAQGTPPQERLRITSGGKLCMAGSTGQYTLNNTSTDIIIGSGGSGRGITFHTSAYADNMTISFHANENLSRAEGEIKYGPPLTTTTADRNAMMFRTNSAERLRIDSSGSLLVANTTGSRTNLSGNADDIVIGNTSTSNETGITFFSTSATSLRFNDAAGTDGAIEYGHTARSLTFSSANANKMRITQVSGGSQPKVSIGALANSAYLNTSTNGDRSTVKVGNYLHLDSGGNGNFTAGMYYNCWPNGQAYFQSGTVAPSSGDNRAAAVVCRYGSTYIYGDNSTTAWSSGNTITSMQRNMQVTSAGYVLKPNNPSFHVGSPNLAGGNAGAVWRCHANAIYSNVGSHYDNSNGRFTAPITGTYFFFHWGMSNSSGQTNDVYSRKNGSRDQIGTSYNHASGAQHNQFGCSYVRYLTTGDYVDVYTANGNVYNTTDGRHGGWGGWLIG